MSHENEHDRLVKAAFGRAAGARALLATVLPAGISDALDLGSIVIESVDVVGDLLDEGFADLLFTVTAKGDPLFVKFLIEHKSAQRRWVVLDLFASVGRIWSQWRRKHRRAVHVPRVVPIVLYHGDRPWDAPRTIREYFSGDEQAAEAFRAFDPVFPVLFVDVRERSVAGTSLIDAIAGLDAFAGAALWLLKASRDPDFLDQLAHELMRLGRVRSSPGGEDDFRVLVRYVVLVLRPIVDVYALSRMFGEKLGADVEDTVKSLGDTLIDQGRREATIRDIRTILTARFAELPSALVEALARIEDADRLERLVAEAVATSDLNGFRRLLDS